MDKHQLFNIGIIILAVIVIGTGIWTWATPPPGDEPQSWALIAIGIFMIIIGMEISKRTAGMQPR